jgi:histone H3/H4
MTTKNQVSKENVIIEVDALSALEAIEKAFTKQIMTEAGNIAKKRNPNEVIVTREDIDKAWENIQKPGKPKATDS